MWLVMQVAANLVFEWFEDKQHFAVDTNLIAFL